MGGATFPLPPWGCVRPFQVQTSMAVHRVSGLMTFSLEIRDSSHDAHPEPQPYSTGREREQVSLTAPGRLPAAQGGSVGTCNPRFAGTPHGAGTGDAGPLPAPHAHSRPSRHRHKSPCHLWILITGLVCPLLVVALASEMMGPSARRVQLSAWRKQTSLLTASGQGAGPSGQFCLG